MDTSAFRKVYKMDYTTKVSDELDKYLAVLKDVKERNTGWYEASCPNSDAHNSGENNSPIQNTDFSLIILIMHV